MDSRIMIFQLTVNYHLYYDLLIFIFLAMWSDIDYMVDYIDFTIDKNRYPPDRFSKFLKDYNLRFVPILDAGIAIGDNAGYHEGIKRDIFIKNSRGENLIGKVWPGYTHWVDFSHPNAFEYWELMLR